MPAQVQLGGQWFRFDSPSEAREFRDLMAAPADFLEEILVEVDDYHPATCPACKRTTNHSVVYHKATVSTKCWSCKRTVTVCNLNR